ncbi:MAG: hypothetical protein LBG48_05830, partial [Rickettsiales bacterium]|nr:hypothetical protein [Rickettsiales bacterium]
MTKELSQVEKDFCEFMEKNYQAKFMSCTVPKKRNKKTPGNALNESLNEQFAKAVDRKMGVEEEKNKYEKLSYKKPMKHPEDQLHKQIAQYLFILERQGKVDLFTYMPFGEKRNSITGALLKTKGTKKGFPDFMIIATKNIMINNKLNYISYYLYLEAKVGKNKQKTEIIVFLARTEMT